MSDQDSTASPANRRRRDRAWRRPLGAVGACANYDAARRSSRRSGCSSTVATDGTFLTPRNLVLLALQTSIVSLAAISAVMLIVTRNFDLSVGSAVALVGVVVAVLAGQLRRLAAARRAGRASPPAC